MSYITNIKTESILKITNLNDQVELRKLNAIQKVVVKEFLLGELDVFSSNFQSLLPYESKIICIHHYNQYHGLMTNAVELLECKKYVRKTVSLEPKIESVSRGNTSMTRENASRSDIDWFNDISRLGVRDTNRRIYSDMKRESDNLLWKIAIVFSGLTLLSTLTQGI